jgi:hypothetical protein
MENNEVMEIKVFRNRHGGYNLFRTNLNSGYTEGGWMTHEASEQVDIFLERTNEVQD